ncbi:MAG: hypothetical protein K1V99_09620 [Bacteroidales bacterium]
MTKGIYIAFALAFITIGCDKVSKTNNTNNTELPADPTDGLGEIYDFSNVDLENVRFYDFDYNDYIISQYRFLCGEKCVNDISYKTIVVFDEKTKKLIYQYTDYDRPISYTAYGEEHYYGCGFNGAAILNDRMVLLMNYGGEYTKSWTDYIQVYQDGSYKRTTIEEDASEFQLRNWNSDHILFYIPLDRSSFKKTSYIYNTSTSKVIYKGIFACTRHLSDMSFYSMPTSDLIAYIISESDPLRFCTYHGDYIRNYQIVDVSPDLKLYELQKQAILITEVEGPIPLDKVFDNFISEGDYPDKIEYGTQWLQTSYSSVLVEVTRTAFSGRTDTCSLLISIDEEGNTIFERQGEQ